MRPADNVSAKKRTHSGPTQPGSRLQCGSTTAQGIYNPPRKKLYTLQEAARYLGRSLDSMYDLVYSGKIDFHRTGRRYYFVLEDLDRFIEKYKTSYRI